jgi:hypothetical protein
MTREEKISRLKDILSEINENDNAVCYLTSEDNELIKSAIEALEQQPCGDTISRAEAQTAIEMSASRYTLAREHEGMGQVEWSDQLIKVSDAVDIIRNLSSVTPQPKPKVGHWIPVNERLPKPRIDVWCNSDMGQMVGYYDEYVETWYGRDYLELMVTAWMPLPEPYEP